MKNGWNYFKLQGSPQIADPRLVLLITTSNKLQFMASKLHEKFKFFLCYTDDSNLTIDMVFGIEMAVSDQRLCYLKFV